MPSAGAARLSQCGTNLHRTPTPTQQVHWEAVQQAREQGFSLRAIARNLGMAKNTAKKYASTTPWNLSTLVAAPPLKAPVVPGLPVTPPHT